MCWQLALGAREPSRNKVVVLASQSTQTGIIGSLEWILGLLKSRKIRALASNNCFLKFKVFWPERQQVLANNFSKNFSFSFGLPVGVPGKPPGLLQHRNPGNHLQNICFYYKKSSKWFLLQRRHSGTSSDLLVRGEKEDLDKLRQCILKLLRNPGIDSKESITPDYVAWQAGTKTIFLLGSLPP